MGRFEEGSRFNYVTVAAAQTTAQVCGPGGVLHTLTVIPASSGAGAVALLDGSTTLFTTPAFAGATGSWPYTLTLDITATSADGFKVTTGASVAVIVGKRLSLPVSMPRVLGVIPARGGSKRVPRKNLRFVNGKPLIWYTIEAAKKAKRLQDWVVSTEDREIANLVLSYGAHVVKRPEDLAHDSTPSGAVVRHALDWMEEDRGKYDMVVLLHPTSPIRDPKHIDKAIDMLWLSERNTLASVVALPRKGHNNIGPIDAGFHADWRRLYMLNASIYAMKRDWFMQNNKHTDTISIPLVMDRYHSLDVDEEIDLEIAGLYLGKLSS